MLTKKRPTRLRLNNDCTVAVNLAAPIVVTCRYGESYLVTALST